MCMCAASCFTANYQPLTTETFSTWRVEERDHDKCFSIERARPADEARIIEIAEAAYFHPRTVDQTNRDVSKKPVYPVTGSLISRRFKPEFANNYVVLVCKMKIQPKASKTRETESKESADKDMIVGTVYYQKKGSDFTDQTGKEIGELGCLAIDPGCWNFSKKCDISKKLVGTVIQLAINDKMRGVYLYVLGSLQSDGKFSNSLLKKYDADGFKFVENRTLKALYATTPTLDQVVMLNLIDKKMTTIVDKKDGREISIP